MADIQRPTSARLGRFLVWGVGGLMLCAIVLGGQSSLAQPAGPAPAGPAAASAPAGPGPADPNFPASAPASAPATGPTTSTAPASAPASEPATEPGMPKPVFVDGKLELNFQNASVRSILQYLSEAAGFIVIEATPVEGRITIISRGPVTISEAVALLDTVLREKGYAAIRNERVLRIVSSDVAKKELVPVRTGADPNEMGKTDRVITQIIPIKTVDATKLKGDLASVTPGSVDVSTNALSNTLIMTGPEASIRRLAEIIRAIDVQAADPSAVKVFQLKYANATAVARLISDIFKDDGSGTGSPFGGGGARRFMGGGGGAIMIGGWPGAGGGQGGTADAGNRRTGKVVASADDRTNTLVVTAAPDIMKLIETVVAEVDKNPVPSPIVKIYALKNGVAADIAASLNAAFMASGSTGGVTRPYSGMSAGATNFGTSGTGSMGAGAGTGGGGGGRRGGGGGGGLGSSGSVGLGSTAMGGTGTGTGTGTGMGRTGNTGFTGGGMGLGRTGAGTGAVTAPTDLIGQVSFVPDNDTNSLLVTFPDAAGNYERVKAIIEELDRAVPQVLIKVLLAEVTHSDGIDLGVEFSQINLGSAGHVVHSVGTNFQIAGTLARTDEPHGFAFQLSEENVTAAIRALAQKSNLDVLSRPYILTGDNQPASIMVGEQVPVITGSTVTATSPPTTVNSYVYYNIGVIVNVTPHINPVGIVTLDVAPTISAREPIAQGVTIQAGVVAPAFTMRSASARVAIRDGHTIVIGGLMQDQVTDSVDKVPFLGDLPDPLGMLFRHKVTNKQKTELLIFLTPHVAKQPDELRGMSEDELKGAKISNETVEKGVLQEHLEGMKRGAASRPSNEVGPPPPPQPETETRTNAEQLQQQLQQQQP
jgi:general secretion pathway protein D